jgi:hypothetical protein
VLVFESVWRKCCCKVPEAEIEAQRTTVNLGTLVCWTGITFRNMFFPERKWTYYKLKL